MIRVAASEVRAAMLKRSRPGKPLVTVVTVVRNGQQNIESTIQSVLQQTYDNIEYIIIDGASTDGTVNLINKYNDRIDNWISEPDKGIYDAMNKGIDRATGEWINFMNAGDEFYTHDSVEKTFARMPERAEIMYGHHRVILDAQISAVRPAKNLKHLWHGMAFCHQSAFVKADLLKKHKFNIERKIAADYALFLGLYLDGRQFYNSNVVISSITADGLSGRDTLATVLDQWKVARGYKNDFRVNISYLYLVVFRLIKNMFKAALPEKLFNSIRAKL
jgi:glycosyltransferase involved in cell wall biosynthesis